MSQSVHTASGAATTTAYIGGERVAAERSYENIDPATGEVLGLTARCDASHVDAAVAAARAAQPGWAATKPEVRADLLQALAAAIIANREELTLLESQDTGKPLTQARTDATVAARYFTFYGRAIDSYYGLSLPVDPAFHVYTRREALGVCGSVIAWNYPMQLFGRAVAPALATGNTVVLKPADETPRTAVRIAELAVEVGIPAGVLNIVTGIGVEVGAALAEHPGIDHIGFVGSTAVGTSIATAAAQNVIPAVLELGGKSPHVVFPDADLDEATMFITKGILQNAGQTCSAGSRLIVHEDVADELLAKLKTSFERVTIGPGSDDRDLGPLVSVKQQDRVRGLVDGADGRVITGGHVPEGHGAGAFFAPTLIADVDPSSEIAQKEVFGPVLVATTFTDEDEAVRIANGTDYALMAAIWTRDISRAHRLAARVEAGQVYVNAYGAGGGVEYPFGGFKKSGYGREKGVESLDAYTETKTVIVKL
ncbi:MULTISPECIES: aldehyde dehydrogenase family protein [unclassified Pseudoclavibacter]|uniref:aldehyde dehydrogenase family protein n=1 Tax=unclassified Pseudoclavibacter TaxID=2615177 RepID=UPI0012F28ADD|nr:MULTISPECIES: aldehyde dehydrogenase family protein [unclassified Pseudoclavibacter]MBF4460891.1 aldehyde dehydrogenase family protein [Pseudoclavibacter sp. VKM Ac-2867]VXB89365.1 putative aldehyde dehydrogenase DhaS [Pseudoclavibacter sp. 8L]